ncbi:hypothetical protein RKE29_15155 [Streptomyces sp. B1866]|uniref:hypothetical protein n=1 Tax=Streptomyces sp. B1866 TaxID=3075431 RepID=UPI00288D54BE|nr:hypothetical protein [Streptomyces sp. B1866]MDT3397964.1 hypothetical protein [Streptomyces sp. B1866]
MRDLLLGDVSPLTCRSYGHDLLRWFRLLWAVDVGWEQATEAETATLVGWLRSAPNPQRRRRPMDALAAGTVSPKTGKPTLRSGYAPRTIAHNLSVVHGFYAFHLHFGRGPVVNPVPDSRSRRRASAHVSPIEPARPHRRARLRACIRCPMLSINPRLLLRLDELEADLLARRQRAIDEGWRGEVDGLDLTLSFPRSKRAQAQRAAATGKADLGMPTLPRHHPGNGA